MLRKNKNREEKNKELQKKFQEIKEKPVEEANTRIVNVKYRTGCGCGGSYDWFHGEVPIDSDIEDGDYIYSLSEINNPEEGRYWD
jgi:hypothetical protein